MNFCQRASAPVRNPQSGTFIPEMFHFGIDVSFARGIQRPLKAVQSDHAGEIMPEAKLDVITIGRSSVDLYGQQIGSRLEDIGSFAKSVGGCPANIAVGTARLGLKS